MRRKTPLFMGAVMLLVAALVGAAAARADDDPIFWVDEHDASATIEAGDGSGLPETLVLEFWEEAPPTEASTEGDAGVAPGAVFNVCTLTAEPIRYRNPPIGSGVVSGRGSVVCQHPVELMFVTVGLVRDDIEFDTPPAPVVVRMEQARLPLTPDTTVLAASRRPQHVCSKWTPTWWGYTTEVSAVIESRGVVRQGRTASRPLAVKCF